MKITKKKILVISHDAGAAEIVSAYVKKYKNKYDFICLVAGPAVKVFKRKKLDKYLTRSKAKAKKMLASNQVAYVLTGTGWGSSLELDFIKLARKHDIKSVAYLEHWVNLRERFNYPNKDWKQNLPDEFWAGNSHTRDLARKFMSDVPCKLVPNLYYKEMQQEYKKIKKQIKGKAHNILFLSQPIKVNSGPSNGVHLFKFSEFDVLESILNYISENELKNKVVIGFHPSEKESKYDKLITKYSDTVKIAKQSANRLKDIAQAKVVIGISSTILVIAKLCDSRKKVASFIPDIKAPFPIPFKEIIRIRTSKQLGKVLTNI
jgi:hypothetical protein